MPDLHDYRYRTEGERDLIVLPTDESGRVQLRGHGVGVRDGDVVLYTDQDAYRVTGVRYQGHRWMASGTSVERTVSRG